MLLNRKGFTLIELLILLAIFGIIGIIAIMAFTQKAHGGELPWADVYPCLDFSRGGGYTYFKLKCDEPVHVYYATYNVTLSHTRKIPGTHADEYMINRPPQKIERDGKKTWNPEWLKWLSKLEYKHLTNKGDKLYLFTPSGTDSVYTSKQGRWYYFICPSDEWHNAYLKWLSENNIKRRVDKK